MKKLLFCFLFLVSLGAYAGSPVMPPPTVNAGGDSTLTISPGGDNTDTAYLHGTVTSSGSTSYAWSKISGPGTPTIMFASSKNTSVRGLVVGTYTFRLTVTDAGGTASDDVVLTVRTCVNLSPIILTSTGAGITVDGTGFLPGTVFQIDSASGPIVPYTSVYNIKGAPGCPVIMQNRGFLKMRNGFDVRNTKSFVINGKGPRGSAFVIHPGTFDTIGLWIDGHWKETIGGVFQTYAQSGANGLELHEDNEDFEFSHFKISRTKYGMQLKNNEDCDSLKNFPLSHGLQNIRIHDGWISYTESQGIYAGSTGAHNYHSMDRAAPTCGGFPNPARLGLFEWYNLWVDSSGRPNLQLALAGDGFSYVHNNHAWWAGCQKDDAQGGNYIAGAYTNTILANNDFQHAYTWNVTDFGTATYLYNNTIRYGGYSVHTMTSQTAIAPDTLIQLDYGSGVHKRQSQTERVDMTTDSTLIQMKNNTFSNMRFMDIADTNQYVTVLYSSASPSPQTIIPWIGGSASGWSYFNWTETNTYNGAPIVPTPGGRPIRSSYSPAIHIGEKTLKYIPWISAGPNLYTYENIEYLSGFAKGLYGATISSTVWTQVSGPNTATISSPNTLWTAVTNLVPGIYKFLLTVTDNLGAVITDDVYISVGNLYPTASAGSDITIALPTSQVTLSGTSSDPDGTIIEHNWYLKSATNPSFWLVPTLGSLANKRSNTPTVTGFAEAGTYTFRYTSYDNTFLSRSDDVIVTVLANGGVAPPTANAGSDQSISVASVNLSGSASSAAAGHAITAFAWTQISGPNTAIIPSPNLVNVSPFGLISGTYTFQLLVTQDDTQTAIDTVDVTVNLVVVPPGGMKVPKNKTLIFKQ